MPDPISQVKDGSFYLKNDGKLLQHLYVGSKLYFYVKKDHPGWLVNKRLEKIKSGHNKTNWDITLVIPIKGRVSTCFTWKHITEREQWK